jgi:hypothetical protein
MYNLVFYFFYFCGLNRPIQLRQIFSFREDINDKENMGAVLDPNKQVSLEVNAEKAKYMFMLHRQNTRQNQNTKTVNKSSINIVKLVYV